MGTLLLVASTLSILHKSTARRYTSLMRGAFGVTTDALQQRSQTRTSTMPLRQTATSQCCACLPKRVPALTFSLMVSFMPLFLQASSLTEFSSMAVSYTHLRAHE